MALSKVLHGARAVLWIGTTPVGIFNNVSYGVTYDISPVFLLGRTGAAELAYTGMEVVQVTANGFRILQHGPFAVVDKDTGSRLVPRVNEFQADIERRVEHRHDVIARQREYAPYPGILQGADQHIRTTHRSPHHRRPLLELDAEVAPELRIGRKTLGRKFFRRGG